MQYQTTSRCVRWVPTLAVLFASCTGQLEGGDSRGDKGSDGGGKGTPSPVEGPFTPDQAPVAESAGALAFRRLSRNEYGNTVRDLLNIQTDTGLALPADGFTEDGYVSSGPIGDVEVRRFLEAAETVSAGINVEQITQCRVGQADEEGCIQKFITNFGRKAFRRPLTAAEVQAWQAHYKQLRTQVALSFDEATRDVVAAMLQSPHFLYHWQVGAAPAIGRDGLIRLNPHETAARLSYFLWGSLPDDELFAAADKNALNTRAQIEAHARRMLKDERAKDTVVQFHQLWLGIAGLEGLQKDTGKFPEFNTALASSMLEETSRFVKDVYANDGKFETLLTSRRSFLNGPLAKLYGVNGIAGDAFVPATLPEARAGLLTQASFLARKALPGESHPVMRGHFLLVHALCMHTPSPPADIPAPKPPSENLSTRERFAEHSAADCARACHQLIDPLGFAFENFDGLGKFRSMDGGKPVDASGTLELEDQTIKFQGANELVQQLAKNDQARACLAKHWFGFALGRQVGDEDSGSMNLAYASFARKDFDMRELLVALTTTKTFLHRTPSAGEIIQ